MTELKEKLNDIHIHSNEFLTLEYYGEPNKGFNNIAIIVFSLIISLIEFVVPLYLKYMYHESSCYLYLENWLLVQIILAMIYFIKCFVNIITYLVSKSFQRSIIDGWIECLCVFPYIVILIATGIPILIDHRTSLNDSLSCFTIDYYLSFYVFIKITFVFSSIAFSSLLSFIYNYYLRWTQIRSNSIVI